MNKLNILEYPIQELEMNTVADAELLLVTRGVGDKVVVVFRDVPTGTVHMQTINENGCTNYGVSVVKLKAKEWYQRGDAHWKTEPACEEDSLTEQP